MFYAAKVLLFFELCKYFCKKIIVPLWLRRFFTKKSHKIKENPAKQGSLSLV